MILISSFVILILASLGASAQSELLQFYPINQIQYEAILKLTDNKPAVVEGSLINNGLPTLSELNATFSSNFSASWQEFLNTTDSSQPLASQNNIQKIEGYPLCVIKISDLDRNNTNANAVDPHQNHKHEHDHHQHHEHPFISCVVVIKSADDNPPPKEKTGGEAENIAAPPTEDQSADLIKSEEKLKPAEEKSANNEAKLEPNYKPSFVPRNSGGDYYPDFFGSSYNSPSYDPYYGPPHYPEPTERSSHFHPEQGGGASKVPPTPSQNSQIGFGFGGYGGYRG